MKKKIKDLTFLEANNMCLKYDLGCNGCPFAYGKDKCLQNFVIEYVTNKDIEWEKILDKEVEL